MGLDILGGSTANVGIENLRKSLFRHAPGKIVISNRNSPIASAIVVSDKGINLINPNITGGINIANDSVNIQGTTFLTSKATNIKKGEFSENPKSSKMFTYQETVLLESIPIDVVNKAGGIVGANVGWDGMVPIMTDISAGPLPHIHTISMKHVHRLEPSYLYRVPSAVNFIKGAMTQLMQFFKI